MNTGGPAATPETQVRDYSINKRAEQLHGRRDEDGPIGVILFAPAEHNYRCPVHGRHSDELETLH